MARRLIAERSGRKFINIHNDLLHVAWHHKATIERKDAAGERTGIGLDCMSCLVFLAFAFEAQINFLGQEKIKCWKERQPFDAKLKELIGALHLQPDFSQPPYSSISFLKQFRDMVAHGKPIRVEYSEIVEGSDDQIDRNVDLSHGWERHCTPEAVRAAFNDVETIWDEMITAADIRHWDTITRGDGALKVLKVIDDDEATKS